MGQGAIATTRSAGPWTDHLAPLIAVPRSKAERRQFVAPGRSWPPQPDRAPFAPDRSAPHWLQSPVADDWS